MLSYVVDGGDQEASDRVRGTGVALCLQFVKGALSALSWGSLLTVVC